MSVLSSFFEMFIVLGMYNFDVKQKYEFKFEFGPKESSILNFGLNFTLRLEKFVMG